MTILQGIVGTGIKSAHAASYLIDETRNRDDEYSGVRRNQSVSFDWIISIHRHVVAIGGVVTEQAFEDTLMGMSYSPPIQLPVWMAPLDPKDMPDLFEIPF